MGENMAIMTDGMGNSTVVDYKKYPVKLNKEGAFLKKFKHINDNVGFYSHSSLIKIIEELYSEYQNLITNRL